MYFGIETSHPATFALEPGTSRTVAFRVTNNQTDARNLGFRATPLKAGGEQDPSAAEAGWLTVKAPPSGPVFSQASVDVEVAVTVPAQVQPGHAVEFVLVVYDSDVSGADEVSSTSAKLTVTVAGEVVIDEPPPPPKPTGPPWWVFMPAAGIATLWLILVVVSQSGGDREALILIPVILTVVGALGLIVSSAIIGRKKAPIDQASLNYGWGAMAVSAFFTLFAIGCAIAAAVAESKSTGDTAPGLILLVVILVIVVAIPLPLSILVIRRQSAG